MTEGTEPAAAAEQAQHPATTAEEQGNEEAADEAEVAEPASAAEQGTDEQAHTLQPLLRRSRAMRRQRMRQRSLSLQQLLCRASSRLNALQPPLRRSRAMRSSSREEQEEEEEEAAAVVAHPRLRPFQRQPSPGLISAAAEAADAATAAA